MLINVAYLVYPAVDITENISILSNIFAHNIEIMLKHLLDRLESESEHLIPLSAWTA